MSDLELKPAAARASKGVIWSAADFWTQQTSQILTFILVGNMLGPGPVGVMTMGLVTILFVAAFIEQGFSDALIQRPQLEDTHFDTTFWLMLGLGVLGGAALWATAPAIAVVFSEPQLADILPPMAAALPCIAVAECYTAMIRRRLMFRQLAIRSILAYGSGFATALIMARLGYGIDSLVAFFLVSRILSALLVIAVSRSLPGLKLSRRAFRDITGFGKHRVAQHVVAYLSLQSPRIIIGIFLGPVVLGLYSMAERLVAALNNGISGVLQRVAFPVLSSHQSDRSSFDRVMRDFLTFSNLIALPVFMGIAVTSDRLIEVLLEPSWAPMSIVLQILCAAALAGPTNYILMAATNALGRADLVLRLSLVSAAIRVPAVLAAAQIDVVATAGTIVAISFLSVPMFMLWVNRLFARRWFRLMGGVWAPLGATALMTAVVLTVSPQLSSLTPVAGLACQVAVGVVTYAIAIGLMASKTCRRMARVFAG
ncbi:MAG: lipopolysaccharide biosynthesis protein [Dongiaceae bacterium]